MDTQIDLSVIIVSWNVSSLLSDCIHSIQDSLESSTLRYEILVVDSGSSDSSPHMVRDQFPAVRLLAVDRNLGFTGGNNLGIEAAYGKNLMLLNPDTRVVNCALIDLCKYLETYSDVAVVGPQLLNSDGTVQSSRRRFPTRLTGFFESTWLQPYAPKRILEYYYMSDTPDNLVQDVDWVQGAAFLVRREAVETVGLLDQGFFMYSEELEWQHRLKDAGWRIVYYPEARIVHLGGKSSEQTIAFRDIQFHRSKIRYFRKYHGKRFASLLRYFLLANYLWQISLETAKWCLRHKPALRRQRIAAYWTVLQSGLRG